MPQGIFHYITSITIFYLLFSTTLWKKCNYYNHNNRKTWFQILDKLCNLPMVTQLVRSRVRIQTQDYAVRELRPQRMLSLQCFIAKEATWKHKNYCRWKTRERGLRSQACFSEDLTTNWASLVAHLVKNLLPTQETQEMWVWTLGQEDPLEEEMATHFSILALEIPWTEEPGRQQSMELQKSQI